MFPIGPYIRVLSHQGGPLFVRTRGVALVVEMCRFVVLKAHAKPSYLPFCLQIRMTQHPTTSPVLAAMLPAMMMKD